MPVPRTCVSVIDSEDGSVTEFWAPKKPLHWGAPTEPSGESGTDMSERLRPPMPKAA